MLQVEHVKKFYGHFCALDDLTMHISEGSLYGFVGPNGAGKTTAIRIMTGIIYPDEGTVTVAGMPGGYDGQSDAYMDGSADQADDAGLYDDLPENFPVNGISEEGIFDS